MHRISSHTEDELAAFEQQAEEQMTMALQAVMDRIADMILRHAGVPVMAAGPPEDVPGQPYVSPDDLASITPLWREQAARMLPVIAEIYRESGARVHAGLVEATNLPDIPQAASAVQSAYLAQVQNVYEGVSSDLWETARGQLVDGFNNGESIDELADRLRASAGMTARRATLVARSTVVEASNQGSIATARASDLDMRKEWIATNDARTRPTHRTADGQQVDLDASFTVGGFSADVPGDPGLPGQEKYNCRCTVGYVMADHQAAAGQRAAEQEAAQAELPGTSGADLEQQARDRQAQIDSAKQMAELLSEADELAANQASARAFAARMKARARVNTQLPEGAATELTTAREAGELDAALDRFATQLGLTRNTARAGQVTRFDPVAMEVIGPRPDNGLALVVRPGYTANIGGEELQVFRATVHEATEQEANAFRAAIGESRAETIASERRARREAARSRNREIEAAKPYADLASTVDQLIARQHGIWSDELGRNLDQLRIAARQSGIPQDELIAFSDAINDENIGHIQLAVRSLAERRGLSTTGRVGQRVAYDPDTMEPIGEAAYDVGQQVEIWRAGQNLVLADGSSMVLDKAVVRGVSSEFRSANSIMQDAKRAEGRGDRLAAESLAEELGRAYEGQFGQFSTSVRSASVNYDQAHVSGVVLDQYGNHVGDFGRYIRRDEHGNLYAHHSSLSIVPTVQGSGFAARFNAQMFDYYRRSGLNRVTVYANDDIGGYTWAAQGFDFATPAAANTFRLEMRFRLRDEFTGPNLMNRALDLKTTPDILDDDITAFEDLLARAENGEHISAFQFSQVGRKPGQGGKEAMWLGKKLMLGTGWNGVLPL